MGWSIAIATGLYGISFGALAVASGLSILQAQALSLLLFSGGSQFGFIGIIGAGGAPALALSTSTLLGIRNGVYGVQMNALLHPRGPLRFLAAHVTIDESTAVGSMQTDPAEQRVGFWTTGLGIFLTWNLMTLVGAIFGNALGDPKSFGLDGAAVAGFAGLLWPRLSAREPIAIAVACAAVTLIATPFVPSGIPIILAAVVALVVGLRSSASDSAAGGHDLGEVDDLGQRIRREGH